MSDEEFLAYALAQEEAEERGEVIEAPKPQEMDSRSIVARVKAIVDSRPKQKHPGGRPRKVASDKGETVNFNMKIGVADLAKFKKYCEVRGLDMSDVVRKYILEINATHTNSPKELRREEFDRIVAMHKNSKSFNLEKTMEKFKEIEAMYEEIEKGD